MYGVKTCCSTCVHKDVCLYKEQFLNAQQAVDEASVTFPATNEHGMGIVKIRDISWLEPIELRCKHFYQVTGTTRTGECNWKEGYSTC